MCYRSSWSRFTSLMWSATSFIVLNATSTRIEDTEHSFDRFFDRFQKTCSQTPTATNPHVKTLISYKKRSAEYSLNTTEKIYEVLKADWLTQARDLAMQKLVPRIRSTHLSKNVSIQNNKFRIGHWANIFNSRFFRCQFWLTFKL